MTPDTTPEQRLVVLGERFDRALQFAAIAHCAQPRKGATIPYISHLLGVCSLVLDDGGGEDEAIAALLHDAPEDQGGKPMLAAIHNRFGESVAAIVLGCCDTLERPKPPWRERKEAYLAHLEDQPAAVLRVSLADKLFNARAILRDYREIGECLWCRFSKGGDSSSAQLWYHGALADCFSRRRPGWMARALDEVVSELEQAVPIN